MGSLGRYSRSLGTVYKQETGRRLWEGQHAAGDERPNRARGQSLDVNTPAASASRRLSEAPVTGSKTLEYRAQQPFRRAVHQSRAQRSRLESISGRARCDGLPVRAQRRV